MNKSRLLNTMLWLGVTCVATSNVAIAKPKVVPVQTIKMTEQNVQECTQLLDKVAETDKKILEDMKIRQVRAAETSVLLASVHTPSASLNKLLAEKTPAAQTTTSVASVTPQITPEKPAVPTEQAKSEKPDTPPVEQAKSDDSDDDSADEQAKSEDADTDEKTASEKPDVPAVPVTAKKADTPKPVLPANPADIQVFASDDPKAIDHLLGKITTPLMATPDYYPAKAKKPQTIAPKIVKVNVAKPKPSKTTKPQPQPRIRLFTPNSESIDLDDIQGKSVDLNELTKPKRTAPEKPQKTDTSAVKSSTKKKTS